MKQTYVFNGIKKHRVYGFGNPYWSFSDRRPDVRVHSINEEVVHLYDDLTDHSYMLGEMIQFKGRNATVETIARDIETGHYIVYTDYITETVDDESSKLKAEAEKAAYERLKEQERTATPVSYVTFSKHIKRWYQFWK